MKISILLFVFLIGFFSGFAGSMQCLENNKPVIGSTIMEPSLVDAWYIENITIYPNPVINTFKISFKSNNSGLIRVQLFNTIGKQVFEKESLIETGNSVLSVNVKENSIDPGIYFVKIIFENEVYTRKLIVK